MLARMTLSRSSRVNSHTSDSTGRVKGASDQIVEEILSISPDWVGFQFMRGPALTNQELAVAVATVHGLTSRECAHCLNVSVKTIEHHLSQVYRKVGVDSRSELAAVVIDCLVRMVPTESTASEMHRNHLSIVPAEVRVRAEVL